MPRQSPSSRAPANIRHFLAEIDILFYLCSHAITENTICPRPQRPPPPPPRATARSRRGGRRGCSRSGGRGGSSSFLNRGVSIAEIAAREGVTEKRMRRSSATSRPPHAGAAGRVSRPPNEPSQRGAGGGLWRHVGRQPSGGRPGGQDRARARPLSWAKSPPSGACPRANPGSRRPRKARSRSRRRRPLARKRRRKPLKGFNPRPGLAPLGRARVAGGGPGSRAMPLPLTRPPTMRSRPRPRQPARKCAGSP